MTNNLQSAQMINGKSDVKSRSPSPVPHLPASKSPRVAIVHDWLIGGGAERVVHELHKMFPEAPIYTSYCTDEWRHKLNNKVVTGFLQRWPFPKLRKFVPFLRAWWFSRLDLSDYDLVISSSGAEAKGVLAKSPPPTTNYQLPSTSKPLHVAYIHAPTHYYWSRYEQYMKHPGFGPFDWLARIGLKVLVAPMRRWDYQAAQRPDVMIANSRHTRQQIAKYYGRKAAVIHPPVDTERFRGPMPETRKGFVIAGRQTPYKRIDLAVEACTKLKFPLTVIGNGPENEKLRRMAGRTVTFLTHVSDADIKQDFKASQAFIFPGLDDFGIVPVEAMAAGLPVIAYKAGGALDYVVEDKTGLFFEEQTVQSLCDTLEKFDPLKFNHNLIIKHAENFSIKAFRRRFTQLLTDVTKIDF